ncbi:MAG: hypothetical protein CFE44_02290 [Burkholderiales bacterium PBB4]|nr:MAG: hypothetical protein CFE44_02290 [Burkholderiales bacterium PBB4]
MRLFHSLLALLALLLLAACAGPQYTVDDGRKVNEELLGNIRTYGAGERALRPAIARSAKLRDKDCDKQWELPFSVATSYDLAKDDRVAWVRALGVDERLTVVGAAPDSPLQLRDKIALVGRYATEDAQQMLLSLAELRDDGRPFQVVLSTGKSVQVTPFEACRGYTRLAPANLPKSQDYHWLLSMHPLQVAQADLSEDEALWVVLWTQGVSEEGGARMKTFHYSTKIAGTLYNLFTIASGLQGAALAADAAIRTAQSAAATAATEVLKKQLIDQASTYAASKIRDEVTNVAKTLTQAQVVGAMQQAAANRGALSGVAWIAATVFDKADAWAMARMETLGANPLAGFSLHQKLIEKGLASNSMVLDQERLSALSQLASAKGRGDDVVAILGGFKPADLQLALGDMPLASAPRGFSYDDPHDAAEVPQAYARGLIDSMLSMPVASGAKK